MSNSGNATNVAQLRKHIESTLAEVGNIKAYIADESKPITEDVIEQAKSVIRKLDGSLIAFIKARLNESISKISQQLTQQFSTDIATLKQQLNNSSAANQKLQEKIAASNETTKQLGNLRKFVNESLDLVSKVHTEGLRFDPSSASPASPAPSAAPASPASPAPPAPSAYPSTSWLPRIK